MNTLADEQHSRSRMTLYFGVCNNRAAVLSPGSSPLGPQGPAKGATLQEMQGQIYHLTKYQAGCRFLQKQLEDSVNNPENATIIFNEVADHILEMMTGIYGKL